VTTAPVCPCCGRALLADGGDASLLVRGGEEDPLLPHLVGGLDGAERVDIAVAFTMESGVALIEEHLRDVLARGGRVRFVTGDYLGHTEPNALRRLLDLHETAPLSDDGDRRPHGDLALRVFESGATSFHPKAYILVGRAGGGSAFVGSSNLSRSALRQGVEWNYRVLPSRDATGFADVARAFEELFAHPKCRVVDQAWIDDYEARRLPTRIEKEEGGPVEAPPETHSIQAEALAELRRTRQTGHAAGLVVLATGLGKTWLSAFDSQPYRRVLFIAHREEILAQAMRTFRRIRPTATLGLYTGREKAPTADVLFASIQTLSRVQHLHRFEPDAFDYVVVDEFHHAAASTYRRVIGYLEPKFLLGLTATPERTDGGDLLALCGDNLVHRCDVGEGIRRGLLSPFAYFGVPDDVDYENIPWRSSRFDEDALTAAVATTVRAENALEQLRNRGGKLALGFCVSQRHADFMADYFVQRGVRAVAVHAGDSSAPRATSLERLAAGDLDIVFAVDMFNEGVDLPSVDTVLMLRPTESRILWLQQFGRGLRQREGKTLRVIDYIGNHRVFLVKTRALLSLGDADRDVAYALTALEQGTWELPPGCSVTYDLEAKEMLQALVRPTDAAESLEEYYREFVARHGVRPRAMEAYSGGSLKATNTTPLKTNNISCGRRRSSIPSAKAIPRVPTTRSTLTIEN
jgi:superfamily II DNA or RNA helicase